MTSEEGIHISSKDIAVQNFCFNNNNIRVLADDPENPWFVAKDVCDVLGLTTAHIS